MSFMGLSLVVLAAGMGSRYGGLKQLDRFGPRGETLLEYSMFDAVRAGFDHIICVIRKEFEEEFQRVILSRLPADLRISLTFQEMDNLPEPSTGAAERKKPWGTGHAVWTAKDLIDGPFGVINADDFYGAQAYAVLAGFLKSIENKNPVTQTGNSWPICLVTYHLENTLSEYGPVSRGVCVLKKGGLLQKIEEYTHIEPSPAGPLARQTDGSIELLDRQTPVSMNMFGFSPEAMRDLENQLRAFIDLRGHDPMAEFYIPYAVTEMMATDGAGAEVTLLPTEEKWFGITYAQDRKLVKSALARRIEAGVYPCPLWR